ncbi:mechanosensitive ion channel family protein [Rickettsiales bacterium LUAb2]
MISDSIINFFIQHIPFLGKYAIAYNALYLVIIFILALFIFYGLLKFGHYALNKLMKFIVTYKKNILFLEFLIEDLPIRNLIIIFVLEALSVYNVITIDGFPTLQFIIDKLILAIQIFLIAGILSATLKSFTRFLKTKPTFHDKPLESYTQILNIIMYFFAVAVIYVDISNKSFFTFFTTLGAISAILLLVFKDLILGFVASVQVTSNNMLKIGDWITFNKHNADGNVTEINLTTVKVQNFDKTISTIPTYALIADSFQNWRGMINDGNRRIKRDIRIRPSSITYITQEQLAGYQKIDLLKSYIAEKLQQFDKYDKDNEVLLNGIHLTNLGLYRKYIELYLINNSNINNQMTIMARQLPIEKEGSLPIELYCFSKDPDWVNYENIQADILEHLYAAIHFFKLELYEK